MGYKSNSAESDFPEFGVRYETISKFFSPPLAKSTFYDLVNKGKIKPMKKLKGFYLLNESLRRLGLREVRQIAEAKPQSMEDITRLAFTIIDPLLFPAPPWLLGEVVIGSVTSDHVSRIVLQHDEEVEALDHPHLKLAYFAGVLDAQILIKDDDRLRKA